MKRLWLALLLISPLVGAAPRRIPGAETILKPGARVLFGEMHGNHETQTLIADVVAQAVKLSPVRVGLEIPSAEQARIDQFLQSKIDRRELLKGEFWTREVQDGRSSVAMAALLESLRQLVHEGADVKVIAFDVPDAKDRDQAMAEKLAAALDAKTIFIGLAGNLHARKKKHPEIPGKFMAQYLTEMRRPVTTLDVRYGEGTTWACMPECKSWPIGKGKAPPVGIHLEPTEDGAYDGTFSIGKPTHALPAIGVNAK